MIKAVYETVYQCYGVLQALHVKLCSRNWVQRDPWNHDSESLKANVFGIFPLPLGILVKAEPLRNERVPWHPDKGVSARGGCLARFRSQAQPRSLNLPCILLPLVPLQATLPSLIHPLLIIHRQSTNPFCLYSTLVSSPSNPKATNLNSNGLPLLAWWQRPCLQCPADPWTHLLLPYCCCFCLMELRAYSPHTVNMRTIWNSVVKQRVSQHCSSRTQPLVLAKYLGILKVLPWE